MQNDQYILYSRLVKNSNPELTLKVAALNGVVSPEEYEMVKEAVTLSGVGTAVTNVGKAIGRGARGVAAGARSVGTGIGNVVNKVRPIPKSMSPAQYQQVLNLERSAATPSIPGQRGLDFRNARAGKPVVPPQPKVKPTDPMAGYTQSRGVAAPAPTATGAGAASGGRKVLRKTRLSRSRSMPPPAPQTAAPATTATPAPAAAARPASGPSPFEASRPASAPAAAARPASGPSPFEERFLAARERFFGNVRKDVEGQLAARPGPSPFSPTARPTTTARPAPTTTAAPTPSAASTGAAPTPDARTQETLARFEGLSARAKAPVAGARPARGPDNQEFLAARDRFFGNVRKDVEGQLAARGGAAPGRARGPSPFEASRPASAPSPSTAAAVTAPGPSIIGSGIAPPAAPAATAAAPAATAAGRAQAEAFARLNPRAQAALVDAEQKSLGLVMQPSAPAAVAAPAPRIGAGIAPPAAPAATAAAPAATAAGRAQAEAFARLNPRAQAALVDAEQKSLGLVMQPSAPAAVAAPAPRIGAGAAPPAAPAATAAPTATAAPAATAAPVTTAAPAAAAVAPGSPASFNSYEEFRQAWVNNPANKGRAIIGERRWAAERAASLASAPAAPAATAAAPAATAAAPAATAAAPAATAAAPAATAVAPAATAAAPAATAAAPAATTVRGPSAGTRQRFTRAKQRIQEVTPASGNRLTRAWNEITGRGYNNASTARRVEAVGQNAAKSRAAAKGTGAAAKGTAAAENAAEAGATEGGFFEGARGLVREAPLLAAGGALGAGYLLGGGGGGSYKGAGWIGNLGSTIYKEYPGIEKLHLYGKKTLQEGPTVANMTGLGLSGLKTVGTTGVMARTILRKGDIPIEITEQFDRRGTKTAGMFMAPSQLNNRSARDLIEDLENRETHGSKGYMSPTALLQQMKLASAPVKPNNLNTRPQRAFVPARTQDRYSRSAAEKLAASSYGNTVQGALIGAAVGAAGMGINLAFNKPGATLPPLNPSSENSVVEDYKDYHKHFSTQTNRLLHAHPKSALIAGAVAGAFAAPEAAALMKAIGNFKTKLGK
jgi:hypothetical protein